MKKEKTTMTVYIENLTEAQKIALSDMFAQWQALGNVGSSRWVSFFADGDGDFRPLITIDGVNQPAFFGTSTMQKARWKGDEYRIDFDEVSGSLRQWKEAENAVKAIYPNSWVQKEHSDNPHENLSYIRNGQFGARLSELCDGTGAAWVNAQQLLPKVVEKSATGLASEVRPVKATQEQWDAMVRLGMVAEVGSRIKGGEMAEFRLKNLASSESWHKNLPVEPDEIILMAKEILEARIRIRNLRNENARLQWTAECCSDDPDLQQY